MVQSGNIIVTGAGVAGDRRVEDPAAAEREAALMLLLRDLSAMLQAQRSVIEMLGREVTGTSDFIEARVGAICRQLGRLLPAATSERTAAGAAAIGLRANGAEAPTGVDHGVAHAASCLITEVQFQDRARQRLQFVTDTLSALAECSDEADRAIAVGLHESPGTLPDEFIRFTAKAADDALRRVEARIAACMPEGGPSAVYGGEFPSDEGVVDLF